MFFWLRNDFAHKSLQSGLSEKSSCDHRQCTYTAHLVLRFQLKRFEAMPSHKLNRH